MPIDLKGKTYRNLQEQVLKNAEDIDILKHKIPYEDEFYTKTETDEKFETIGNVNSKDAQVLLDAKNYTDEQVIPVSGTNNGTNWLTITIGEETYNIPQKSEINNYKANIVINAAGYANLCFEVPITEDYVSLDGYITKNQLEALLKDITIAYGKVTGTIYSFNKPVSGGVVGTYDGNTHLLPASYIFVMATSVLANISFQVFGLAVSLSDLESASATYSITVYNY